jgi:hypothetical protein
VESKKPVGIEHQNVPVGHQGLHEFLYSSEDEHTSASGDRLEDDSAGIFPLEIWPLEVWCDRSNHAKVAGVYAVLNPDRCPQYIGYSRNVSLSLKSHLTQFGSDICALVRVQPFKFPKREEMEKLRDAWITELGQVPPGNAIDSEGWAGTIGEAAIAAMSVEDRQIYEEKKLKLRKAMAEQVLSQEDAIETSGARHENLKAAIEDDNWSAVVQEQTQETHL